MAPEIRLRLIRTLHTLVWAVFASAILAIPILAYRGSLAGAWACIGFVLLEVAVLAANRLRCPLTDLAGRYTADRQDNFDIYLPLWLARHNKLVFGGLYLTGIVYTVVLWATGQAAP